ncbi:MAG: hypothetical protein HKN73_12540, partial [Gemmatimonadetes bacterium]|nr:hypothetical protein [Gemmatimonadota bacterium]
NDPRPYDDVGWTVGPLLNTIVVRVEDTDVLDTDMRLVSSIALAGGVEGGRGDTYLINYNADANLARFRFAHADLNIAAAESPFESEDRTFNAGTFVLNAADHPGVDLDALLDEAGRTFGFTAYRTRSALTVDVHPVRTPRLAVVHTWTNTQDEGWLRFGLDEYGIPFDYLSVHDIRDTPDLRGRYDVIVMGQTRGDALSIVRGLTGDEPIPWQASQVTPNIGRQDSTPDMRGGLGLEGVLNLKAFAEAGGVLVTMARASQLPVHFGLADGVRIRETPGMWARGGVFSTRVTDAASPITYGYDDLGVAFNTSPVFAIGGGGGGFGGFGGGGNQAARGQPGSTTERRTGRGGIDEEDIVQGRARNLGQERVEAFREEHGDDEDSGGGFGGAGPSTDHIRVVMRFADRVEDLLISGGLENGQPLVDAPAAVDVPLGDGHVVMFSFNPFWRGHTHGSYALLFNTLMHHDALDVSSEETLTEEDPPEAPNPN